ncbi:Saccharopine dehydrogenase-domain-containing protein [Infundibulicybe gibba]|nr:Saccharopine dehydrogenase-domain-containing protein [Infundibulicybe gibba]
MKDILILGATGFTGKLITRYLTSHPERRQYSFSIAARDPSKLASLASEARLPSDAIHIIDTTNVEQLTNLIARFKVVINAIGHYYASGTAIVDACVVLGVDYLDLSGELPWNKQIIEKHDRANSRSTIIQACGFESIPSDICVFESVSRLLREHKRVDIGLSRTAMSLKAFAVSQGTLSSALSLLENVPRSVLWDGFEPYSLSPVQGKPPLRARLVSSLKHIGGGYGSFSLLGIFNKPVVNRSWGLLQEYGHQDLTYGPNFSYEEVLVSSSSLIAMIVSLVSVAMAYMLLYLPPVRWVLKRLANSDSANPDYAGSITNSLTATNVTWASPAEHYAPVRTTFKTKNCDIAYFGASVMISECALSLVLTPREQLPLSHIDCRVLTATTALGHVLTDRLRRSEYFDIRTEVVQDDIS